jgi:hypothetical protein
MAIATAVPALAVSIATAWWTSFHQGAIRMAEPSMVVLACDAAGFRSDLLIRRRDSRHPRKLE